MEIQGKRAPLYGVLLVAVALRAALYALPGIQSTLSGRPELVTAVTSFRRVKEAAFLVQSGKSPYTGDVFHQPPLVFAFFYPIFLLPEYFQYMVSCFVFIAIDVVIALGLARLCERTHFLEEARISTYKRCEIWLNQIPLSPIFASHNLPAAVAMIYLFNPYSLASSLAMSTANLTFGAVLYALVFAAEGALAAASLWLAVATYLSVYPVVLLVPVALLLQSNTRDKSILSIAVQVDVVFDVWVVALLFLSKTLTSDWQFLQETYVWIAAYSDLTPNVGIFWYFFIEVFDRFIPYFLLVLHLHPLIYIAPIYLRLSHRPQVYAASLFGIASLFQAYPSFGGFGFFLALISIHPKSIALIKNRFAYGLGLAVASCMLPVMWFLWVFPGSGNANFFYNQTLVYQIFNTQLISAFVSATMKRDKDIQLFIKREDAKLQDGAAVDDDNSSAAASNSKPKAE